MSERISGKPREHVVVCVDGPNADNQAAAWGAMNAFNNEAIDLAAVIVSGTAVDYRENAPIGSRDDDESARVQLLHTARMANLFKRGGSDVPVFMGQDVRQTAITTPIPHSAHVRHEDYDIYNDNTPEGRSAIAGDFTDALSYLAGLEGRTHIVVGGPFTEIPYFLQHPHIYHKLGYLAAQAGFEISERAIYSKLAFNHEVDEASGMYTYVHYPNEMVYVPSDITRAPAATFSGAEELLVAGVYDEIGAIFMEHRKRASERHAREQEERAARGEKLKDYPRLSIHDLQAVMALRQVLGLASESIFEFAPIDPQRAIHNMIATSKHPETLSEMGRVGLNMAYAGQLPARYVVSAQDAVRYKSQALELLR